MVNMDRRSALKIAAGGMVLPGLLGGEASAAAARARTPAPMNVGWQAKVLAKLESLRINLLAATSSSAEQFTRRPQLLTPFTPAQLLHWRVTDQWDKLLDYFVPFIGPMRTVQEGRSLEEFRKIFTTPAVRLPDHADRFEREEVFAENFVAGMDPTRLVRMTEIPAKFPISTAHLQAIPELAGEDLEQAVKAGRIYWIDYKITEGLRNGRHGEAVTYMYSPMIAFFIPRDGGVPRPFAIQCGQQPAGRQIYTPADGYSWMLARNCVMVAHTTVHEALTHLGNTHLLMESLLTAARPSFRRGHPLAKLFRHHFAGTPFINQLALDILLAPGGWLEHLIGADLSSLQDWVRRRRVEYSFRDNYLPNRLARSGTSSPKDLPNYPYRDDGLPVWEAVAGWMTDFVAAHYASDAEVRADAELQTWAGRVVATGEVRDFGATPGGIGDRQDLVEILTMTLWTAGPQHAAVNFSQDEYLTFLPASPMAGFTPEPTGTGHTRRDWLDNFPTIDIALLQLNGGALLGTIQEGRLGYYGNDFTGSRVEEPLARFQRRLVDIDREIDDRNSRRATPYPFLKPSLTPNSINI